MRGKKRKTNHVPKNQSSHCSHRYVSVRVHPKGRHDQMPGACTCHSNLSIDKHNQWTLPLWCHRMIGGSQCGRPTGIVNILQHLFSLLYLHGRKYASAASAWGAFVIHHSTKCDIRNPHTVFARTSFACVICSSPYKISRLAHIERLPTALQKVQITGSINKSVFQAYILHFLSCCIPHVVPQKT